MPLNTFSPRRPLTSYSKVQTLIGAFARDSHWQLRSPRVLALDHLDIGCGPNPHDDFINLDYRWHPKIDVCWNITRGLPFPDASLRGVFSEHCLEHFDQTTAVAILREVRRVLMPGGIFRVIIPDAGAYLQTYAAQSAGDKSRAFPYQADESRSSLWSPLSSVNRVFYQDRESPFGHRCMYDFALLSLILEHCGLTDVRKRGFGEGDNPRLLIDTPSRACESLYVEAQCPAA